MNIPEYIVNLDAPPEERWEFLRSYKDEIEALLTYYLNDLAGIEFVNELIPAYRAAYISEEYVKEIATIAGFLKFSNEAVLLANLYYDILKSYFGCTAFAVDNEEGLFHGRNLDWHTENKLLSKYTAIFDFQKNGKTIFKSVGWKGFIGVLSGIHPKNFSFTLNAILSDDPPEIAYPISFFIRDVLTNANSFDEAKTLLENKMIASDCLLLLSGVASNEFVVIERTPTRFATRSSSNNRIVVTNDYKLLKETGNNSNENILAQTSCQRYERTKFLLGSRPITAPEDCLGILKDEDVKMNITVQQMVFNNRKGTLIVENMIA